MSASCDNSILPKCLPNCAEAIAELTYSKFIYVLRQKEIAEGKLVELRRLLIARLFCFWVQLKIVSQGDMPQKCHWGKVRQNKKKKRP